MKDFETINLKEFGQTQVQAIKELEIFVDLCKNAGVKAIKVVHGYGSGGKGGVIAKSVLLYAKRMQKLNKIQFYLNGPDWNLANKKALQIIYSCKSHHADEDLNKQNPGITILFL